jgi:hypothetical protein
LATYLIDSKAAIAKSQQVMQAIDDGLLPKPPTTGTRIYRCDRCGAKTSLTAPSKYAKGRVCADCNARLEWFSVKALVEAADTVEHKQTSYYDSTCGMKSRQRFALDLLMETFVSFAEVELEIVHCLDDLVEADGSNRNLQSLLIARNALTEGFNSAAHIYLAAIGNCRLSSKTNNYTNIDMAWHATVVYDYYARRRYPVKFTVDRPADAPQPSPAPRSDAQRPEPMFLPQQLQSREDIMEAVAMSKVIPNPARLTELHEATEYGVEHYDNEEARIIFDGYYLERSESGVYIYLKHKEHPNRLVVGAADIVTGEMECVAERSELKEFMAKVYAGMAPSGNPHLPGIMMQQPIPEDAKREPARTKGGSQYAEVAPDELPLFAQDGPESAA